MGNSKRPLVALRSDGIEFPVEASISHAEVNGQPIFTVIMRDISKRIATQRALEDAENRYRSLVENSQGAVMLLDGGTIEYVNQGLVRMLGYSQPADLLGRSVGTVIVPAFHELAWAHLKDLNQGAGRSWPGARLRMRKSDGEAIDVEVTAASIEFEGRVYVQSEMRDITRELRAQAELQALNRTLEERVAERTAELTRANRDLESFSFSVAHDLRAPLRSTSGFAQLLVLDVGEGDYGKLQDHVRRIVDNAEKMNALIDGLLNVARCSRGELAKERVDMQQMTEAVLAELHARASAHVTVGSLPAIWGDAASLRQVWVNLISNALKYSAKQAQPEIAIDCEIVASEAVFRVRDNGAGFDPAYANRLFGVFQRLHAARDFEGTGVGLAIVRAIVERHGGRVWAEGAPGAGATFYFALPAQIPALA